MRHVMILEGGLSTLRCERGMARRERIPGSIGLRAAVRRSSAMLSKLRRGTAGATPHGSAEKHTGAANEEGVLLLSGVAICGRRSTPIRKKIIGHGMLLLRSNFTRMSRLRFAGRSFALLHKPARQHGARVFLEPLIEKRANFLAEIGGVA